jgi:hypothetical protein
LKTTTIIKRKTRMAKPLNSILNGVKKSKVAPGSLGKDAGVDYKPKAGDEDKFVAKHETEKHDDRFGNGDDVFQATNVKYSLDDKVKEPRHGHKRGDDKKVYEGKEEDERDAPFSGPYNSDQKAKDKNVAKNAARKSMKDMKGPKKMEEAKCNMTEAGVKCPVHGMSECMSAKKINEDSGFKAALPHIIKDIKAKKSAQELRQTHGTHYKRVANAASNVHGPKYTRAHLLSVAQTAMKEEIEHVDEAERTSSYLGTYKSPDEAKEKHGKNLRIRPRLGKDNPNKHLYAKGGPLKRSSSQDIKPEHGTRFDAYSRKKTNEDVEQVDEVLTKKTPAGEWIKDFQKSEKHQFAGKSMEKRKQMALAAYYSKQREQKESFAVQPLLGGDIAKHKTDDTQDEIAMVRTELKAIANKTMHLLSNMPEDHHIEPWVQAKIAAAKEMIGSVHDYMMYSDHEEEQTDTPMTFPNMSVDVNTGQNV